MRKKHDDLINILEHEFVSMYVDLEDVSYKEAKRRIENVVYLIRRAVVGDRTVTVPSLGKFYITHRKCQFRNKKTKKMESVSNIGVIRFTPTDSFKSDVNAKIRSANFKRAADDVR